MITDDSVLHFHVYEFPAIDFWVGMSQFRELYAACDECGKREIRGILRVSLEVLDDAYCSWEGDVRDDELYVGGILDPIFGGRVFHYIGLKQHNNGSSFLIFPFEMPVYAQYQCSFSYNKNYTHEIDDLVSRFTLPQPRRANSFSELLDGVAKAFRFS